MATRHNGSGPSLNSPYTSSQALKAQNNSQNESQKIDDISLITDLLVMTIELGQGKQDNISVKIGDDPKTLAQEFAQKHGLSENICASLEQYIAKHKRVAIHKRKRRRGQKSSFSQSDIDADSMINSAFKSKGDSFQRLMKNNPETANFNYGQWLYVQGKRTKDMRNRRHQEMKQKNFEESEQQLTFSPKIRRYRSLDNRKGDNNVEEYLINKHESSKAELDAMRLRKMKNENKNCTFKPIISQKSQQLLRKSRNSSQDRFEELYKDANERSIRRLDLSQSKFINLSNSVRSSRNQSQEDLFNRLATSKIQSEQDLQEARKQLLKTHDPQTGQILYKPRLTSRSPEKRDVQGNIFDYLYHDKFIQSKSKEHLMTFHSELDSLDNPPARSSERSAQIFETFKNQQYLALFKKFDGDGDGLVSANEIEVDFLNEREIDILMPVLEYIHDADHPVPFEEFSKVLEATVRKMNVEDRALLLKREKQKVNPAFANGKRQSSAKKLNNGGVYERMAAERAQREKNLLVRRQEREKDELKGCTFSPRILKNNKKRGSRRLNK